MKAQLRQLGMALALGLLPAAAVQAQVSVGIQIGLPGVNIGVNMPSYPMLVQVPGYPVYYDPQASSNYFFYDGLYWVYTGDNWYASSWYNGPWDLIGRDYVPLYVLRVPVRYYRHPPPYFRGWSEDAPPRWAQHWGHEWEQRRPGWDRWDHRNTPPPAPLPRYQQKYPGDRYPTAVEQQRQIRSEYYRHQPREAVTRQHLQPAAPAPGSRPPVRSEPRSGSVKSQPQQARPRQACKPGTPGCRIEPASRQNNKGRKTPDEERTRP
jgi:hypothetical protein